MLDYKKIGLMSGIEIHRRLDTKKLFCNCSSEMKEQPVSAEVIRTLNVAQSETGTVDVAVLHEKSRDKEFIYKVYPNESCLVELDDEPPHAVNSVAFNTALEVSLLLDCDVPDEIHTMRKIVIDGSNTSGFQRTALVGFDGSLKTSFGNVGITNVSLEEESAQILEEKDNRKVYGLNRLGIPLVEIGTSPDMHTPQQVREVAEKIGSLLKSTGKVKRGLGTIRQDVNVSVKDGARVEIKGAQDLKTLELLVEREAERQLNLLQLRDELVKNNFTSIPLTLQNVSKLFTHSESSILKGKEIHGFSISGFSGLFKRKISGERTLGNEIANYAKVKTGIKGFIHSDENLEKYKITKEFTELRSFIGAQENDLCVIIAADEKTAKRAAQAIVERIHLATQGVPEETRKALPDGTSEYMRPLPGAARMYPETDVPPVHVTEKSLKQLRENLPESLEEKKARFVKEYGLNEELASQIIDSEYLSLFELVVKKNKDAAKEFITKSLGFDSWAEKEKLNVTEEQKETFLQEYFFIYEQSAPKFYEYVKARMTTTNSPKKVIEQLSVVIDTQEAEQFAADYIQKNKAMIESKPPQSRVNVLMGPIMGKYKGLLDGQQAAEIAKKKLKEAGL